MYETYNSVNLNAKLSVSNVIFCKPKGDFEQAEWHFERFD